MRRIQTSQPVRWYDDKGEPQDGIAYETIWVDDAEGDWLVPNEIETSD